jgi:hypothetical protein
MLLHPGRPDDKRDHHALLAAWPSSPELLIAIFVHPGMDHVRSLLAAASYGVAPGASGPGQQFGNGDLLPGDWIPRTDLPIWEPGFAEAELRILIGETA